MAHPLIRSVYLIHRETNIRRNNEITLKEMKENLSKMYYKSVSTSTISRHLHEYGY
jgi:hypothetical protein